jgi:hypothetical protein
MKDQSGPECGALTERCFSRSPATEVADERLGEVIVIHLRFVLFCRPRDWRHEVQIVQKDKKVNDRHSLSSRIY